MGLIGATTRGAAERRTPDTGIARAVGDTRGAEAIARALMTLVERLESTGDAASAADTGLRDALRQLAARSRDSALLCRIVDDVLVLEGGYAAPREGAADAVHDGLRTRLVRIGAASLTIRDGASPGELLTLAMMLASSTNAAMASVPSQTPTTVHVFGDVVDAPQELLRTWSVLVMPVQQPKASTSPVTVSGQALTKLAHARTDDAVTSAVATLMVALEDAIRRGDAMTVESIARGTMAHLQTTGSGGGRLALEAAIRHLLQPQALALLALRLPMSTERGALLQLMSRAGDLAVETLTNRLLQSDEPIARRAYFDGIVAMDVGSPLLFELLHDPRWYVVRNAAALLGEMRVDHSDDALVPLLRHTDDRIRIAAARSLSRVRTPKALRALHAAIDDAHPEVRRISASAFGLATTATGSMRPPAARLSLALEREQHEDVALEMLAALGRLGSADAVQRLLRIAMAAPLEASTGERNGDARDAWQRIAALEALVRARGHAMTSLIENLMTDADREVAAAAKRLRPATTTTANDP